MSSQIVGYYVLRKDKLLRDFDKTSVMMKAGLVMRFGEEFADRVGRDIRKEYEILIPEIPYIPGWRPKILNAFLLITAQELAANKVMTKLGKSSEQVWELCHAALRLRTAMIPSYKKWLLRKLMFSGLVRKIFSIRVKNS